MPNVPPVVPPVPLAAVVPTRETVKRSRDPAATKTQTARAVGTVRRPEDARNDTGEQNGDAGRGHTLDTLA